MGAAGTIEAIACLLAMERGEVPPTVGLVDADPECDLNHVAGAAQPCRVRVALTNSAGIGGSNASLVLRSSDGGVL
jgi:3-oxoacyl-[acyl-carrier-protein] synthase II